MEDEFRNLKELQKKLDYKGCRNCEHQIEPLRMCVWAETNPQTMILYICPNWVKRGEEK